MRVLFCSLASHGFLYPFIGLALELQHRGHEVAFVTDRIFEKELLEQGLLRIPRGERDGPSFQVKMWSEAKWAAIQTKHVEYALQVFEPDILVSQPLCFGPLLVAETRNIPIGIMGFLTYQFPLPSAPNQDTDATRRLTWRYSGWVDLYNETRRLFGLSGLQPDLESPAGLGDLFMLRNVPELVSELDRLPQRVHFVGDCIWAPPASPDPALDEFLQDRRQTRCPVFYVQHGRVFDHPHFWTELKKAVGAKKARVVASIGRMDFPLGEIPTNFLVRPHVEQGRVLKDTDVLITTGTTTPVLGALRSGTVSLIIPIGGEQPDIADFCRHAGVGRTISPPASITASVICSELEELLSDPSYSERARFVSEAFVRYQGFEVPADLLETLASTRAPVLREGRRHSS